MHPDTDTETWNSSLMHTFVCFSCGMFSVTVGCNIKSFTKSIYRSTFLLNTSKLPQDKQLNYKELD